MNIKVKYFILVVLLNGLPYAFFMAMFSFDGMQNIDWLKFIFSFIFFGGVMGIFNTLLLSYELSEVGIKNLNKKNLEYYLNPTFTIFKSVDEIIDLLQRSDYKTSIEEGNDKVVLVCPSGFLRTINAVKVTLIYKNAYETECVITTVPTGRQTFLAQISDIKNISRVTKLIGGSYNLMKA